MSFVSYAIPMPSYQKVLAMPDPKRSRAFKVASLTVNDNTYDTKYCPEVIPAEDGYPEILNPKWTCTCEQFQHRGVCKHIVMVSLYSNKKWEWLGKKVRFQGTEFEETVQDYIEKHVEPVES